MPSVNKSVNKTLVNGSEVFIYTINVSYSDLAQPALEGKLVDFFPDKILFQLPKPGGQLVSIEQFHESGGTNVQFNFGAVNAGTSLSFTVACQFGPGRVDNDSFINSADLYADNTKVASGSAPEVNLVLDENFTLYKITPVSGTVKPGDEIIFRLLLKNTNDPGAEITDVEITDTLPTGLSPVNSFTPIGNEYDYGDYSDPTYNGKTGSWSGNTLSFNLPSYNGGGYAVLFKATVDADVTPGQVITNVANWSVDDVDRPDAEKTLVVYEDKVEAVVSKNAPLYGTVGKPIQYQVYTANTGTVAITNFELIDVMPPQVDATRVSFFSSALSIPQYSIYVDTADDPGNYKVVATSISGNSGVYDLATFIPIGGRVQSLKVTAPSILPNGMTNYMMIYGTVNNTATEGQVITNTANATGDSTLGSIDINDSGDTTLDGKSVLNVSKVIEPLLPVYYPLDAIPIELRTSANSGWIVDPVFADLLPEGLDYVPNSEYFGFYDAMSGVYYDSRNAGFPITKPVPQVIKNYQGTGRTLVRFKFIGFTLQYLNRLSTFFNAIVLLDPPSTFTNNGFLGNPGKNTVVVGTPYTDVNDLDGDDITNEQIAESNGVGGVILTTSEFSLEKWVKGDLALDFSKASTVTAGGDIVYNLNVTNNQKMQLKNIEIVDILPYVGDTGVILNTTPRGSKFDVYATANISVKIVNVLGDPVVDPDPAVTIQYSTSNNPVRFNEQGTGTIGVGLWENTPPEDITELRSIKVITDPSVVLNPYERLIVTINAKAPVGAPLNEKAYNSYAVRADKISGGQTTKMNPAEPNKVSVQIEESFLSSIGQFVWNDLNGDGIYQANEPGVNGVKVELYDSNLNFITSTVTANDFANNPGYYRFNNLTAGNYFVRFIPFGPYNLTVQKATEVNGSRPNPTTGFTNLIVLDHKQNLNTVNAGLLENSCKPPIIYACDKCIFVGETFNPMKGVTAFDCSGENITASIMITFNNVNTWVPGLYSVTYSVTDKYKQTTVKTISVRVSEKDPHYQAVTDLYESIALEQAGLALILDAEGKKIQKAKALKLPYRDMIKINASVKEMADAITRLEMVLQSKLELFKCNPCGTCSCDEPLDKDCCEGCQDNYPCQDR